MVCMAFLWFAISGGGGEKGKSQGVFLYRFLEKLNSFTN